MIGNPPFGGKNTILASNGDGYIKLFQKLTPHAHGNADYCAYFFLLARRVLRESGCFGLIGTNTLSQGDTRGTGLQHLVTKGGISLYEAVVDIPWPVAGGAAVVVDFVHGCRGDWTGGRRLDGEVVPALSSELKGREELADPVRLRANDGRSFQGHNVLGTGFFLTCAEAQVLLESNSRNAEVARPYIGGRELNSSPELEPERLVICFGERSLEELEAWPKLLAIVRERVKPQRDGDKRTAYRQRWWRFAEYRTGLVRAVSRLERCLGASLASKHLLFAFLPSNLVFGVTMNVFAFDDWYHFGILQSRLHQYWARQPGLSSALKTDPRYTVSKCFRTFPFPRPTDPQKNAVARAGKVFYEKRSEIMRARNEGMTKVWNRLLDEHEEAPDIALLRRLRTAMDRAALEAYGWPDVDPQDREEIVRRLRTLNAERAAEEARGT